MKPVFMENDFGGIVFVGKNELALHFTSFPPGVEDIIRINTRELLERLWRMTPDEWETDDFLIEPRHCGLDGALLVIITKKFSKHDSDKATVYRCDLIEALEKAESIEWL